VHTKIAPAELIFIKSNSSKLLQRVNDTRTTSDIQRFAKENDKMAKQNMQTYADKRRRAANH
jgi:hypothetical protein